MLRQIETEAVMKHFKLILFVLALFCQRIEVLAQDVNGVRAGTVMSKAQVVECFGEPDEYLVEDYSDLDGVYEYYVYGRSQLLFVNQCFYAFSVSDDRWPLLLDMLDGGVRPGDSFNSIASLNPQPADWLGVNAYCIPCLDDFYIIINTSEGVITNINFTFRN